MIQRSWRTASSTSWRRDFLADHGAQRIRRRIQHQHLGPRGDQGFDVLDMRLEIVVRVKRILHRDGMEQAAGHGKSGIAGVGDQDLVAGGQQQAHGEMKALLRPVHHVHPLGVDVHALLLPGSGRRKPRARQGSRHWACNWSRPGPSMRFRHRGRAAAGQSPAPRCSGRLRQGCAHAASVISRIWFTGTSRTCAASSGMGAILATHILVSVLSGLVIVDKPQGWTSHDVVGRMRRLAGTRKVGHAGTLDPMATRCPGAWNQ